jgi:hypothetical protein
MRQWVLALPPDLHARVARDPELEGRLLAVFAGKLEQLLRATTRTGERGRGGNVPFLKHFRSTLNLHLHFHTLAFVGVYVSGPAPDAPPEFVRAPASTPEQVRWLYDRVAMRARRLVQRRPWNEPPEERVVPVLKVFGAEPREPGEKRLHARIDGFVLHASTAFEPEGRVALERLCRYALRGPIANGRLTCGPRDRLTYRLKTPRPDGTTELVLLPTCTLLCGVAGAAGTPRPPKPAGT